MFRTQLQILNLHPCSHLDKKESMRNAIPVQRGSLASCMRAFIDNGLGVSYFLIVQGVLGLGTQNRVFGPIQNAEIGPKDAVVLNAVSSTPLFVQLEEMEIPCSPSTIYQAYHGLEMDMYNTIQSGS